MIRVGFDLDGVISNTHQSIVDALKSRNLIPQSTAVADMTSWNIEYNPSDGTGFPRVTSAHLEEIFSSAEFWKSTSPYRQTVKSLTELVSSESIEIHVITDRRWFPELGQITYEWLKHHKIPFTDLVICKGDNKWLECVNRKIRFFVDDKPSTILSAAPYVQCAYLYPQPWNQASILPENGVRPYSIEEIVQDLRSYCMIDRLSHRISMIAPSTLLSEKANGLIRTPPVKIGDTTVWKTVHETTPLHM